MVLEKQDEESEEGEVKAGSEVHGLANHQHWKWLLGENPGAAELLQLCSPVQDTAKSC